MTDSSNIIMVNGRKLSLRSGIRQVYQLSPLLFNLGIDFLTRVTKQEKGNKGHPNQKGKKYNCL